MSLPEQVIYRAKVSIHATTDVGRSRGHNEDNFIVCPNLNEKRWYLSDHPEPLPTKGCLLVVADGMGGTNAGEIASEIAVETIRKQFDTREIGEDLNDAAVKDFLHEAVLNAHQAIVLAAGENAVYAGMGTTLVMAWVFPHKAFFAWVGDSRAYVYRKSSGLTLLTSDHSLVWEMVKAGNITPEEADVHPQNNIITQSLGDERRPPEPEFTSCPLEQGDRLMLCSDGLNNMVTHKAIEHMLGAGDSIAQTCQRLVHMANDEGGHDNITVLALEVLEKPQKKKFSNLFGLLSV